MSRLELQIINSIIKEHNTDILILCETWLTKNQKLIDKKYDIFRTADATHQRVCIIANKGTVKKSYVNSGPFLKAVELIYKETMIIRVE